MKSLVVEDELTSRLQLKYFLDGYGCCDVAVNGQEAVEAFRIALEAKKPYDLVCLDIKLPVKDGHQALTEIRDIEKAMGESLGKPAVIFMTTAMGDIRNVSDSYYELCDEYLTKPVEKARLDEKLLEYKLIRP